MRVDWDSLYGSSWSYIDNLTSYNLQEDIIVPDGEKNLFFCLLEDNASVTWTGLRFGSFNVFLTEKIHNFTVYLYERKSPNYTLELSQKFDFQPLTTKPDNIHHPTVLNVVCVFLKK